MPIKSMTKEEYLELCSKNWEALQAATSKNNLYDLEKDFRRTWEGLGCEVLEKELGKKVFETSQVLNVKKVVILSR